MRLLLLGLAAGLLCAVSGTLQTAQAAVERQESFRDWQAVCQTDKSCQIQTHIPGGASAGGTKFRLRVSRKRPNGDFSISIAAPGIQVNAKNTLTLRVDQSPSAPLEPDVGFVALDAENTFFVARRDVTLALILAMRAGGKFIADIPLAAGGSQSVDFSLSGFSKAFEFIGGPAANVPSASLITQPTPSQSNQPNQAAQPPAQAAQKPAPAPQSSPVVPPVATVPPATGPANQNASAPLFPTLQTQGQQPAASTNAPQAVGPTPAAAPVPRTAPRETEVSANSAPTQTTAEQSGGYELLPPPPGTFDPSAPASERVDTAQAPASPLFGGAMTNGTGAAGSRGATLSSQTQTSTPSLLTPSNPNAPAGTPVAAAPTGTQVSALFGGAVQPGTVVSPPPAVASGVAPPQASASEFEAEGRGDLLGGTNGGSPGSLITPPSSVSPVPTPQAANLPPVVTNVPRSQSITGGEVIAATPTPPPSGPATDPAMGSSPLFGGAVDPNAPPAASSTASESFDLASASTSGGQAPQSGPTSLIAPPVQTPQQNVTPLQQSTQPTNSAALSTSPAEATAPPSQPASIPETAVPQTSWPESIVPHLSTIKRCFGRIPDPPGRVTTSWAFGNGVVGVVARGADDSKWVCLSLPDDPDFVMIRRAGNDESLPAEGPSFRLISPDTGTPVCKRHKEVFDEFGTSVGWLTYDDC